MTRILQGDNLIGDFLMVTPTIRALKREYPDDKLFYHVPIKDPKFGISGHHALLYHNPNLDGILIGDEFQPNGETVIPMAPYKAYLWGCLNKKTIAEGLAHYAGVEIDNLKYDYYVQPEEWNAVNDIFRNLSEGKPAVAIARHSASCTSNDPKVRIPNKCLPNAVWVAVADWLLEEGFMPIAVGASRDEKDIRYRQFPGKKLYGLPMREFAAFLSRCHACLTIDTGCRHLAAAVGTNMACISGMIPLEHIRCEPVRDGQKINEVVCKPPSATLHLVKSTAWAVL